MGVEVVYDRDNTLLHEISRDSVAEETDVATLHDWFNQLRVLEMEVGTQIGAMVLQDESRIPAGRKLGFTRIAMRWVQLRLAGLGEFVDGDPHSAKMRNLLAELDKLRDALSERNDKIKAQNVEITSLKAALKAAKREAVHA